MFSPHPSDSNHQQFAALTAALLKQQQCQQDAIGVETDGQLQFSSEELHDQQMKTRQQVSFGSLNPQAVQGLHNLQNLHQIQQQLTAAAATSGMPMNPVDMLNLMQFHHLISLNFMNLAPPLIFGASATSASSVAGSAAGVHNNGIPAGSSTGTAASCLADLQQVCPGTASGAEASSMNITPQSSGSNNSQVWEKEVICILPKLNSNLAYDLLF